MYIHIIYIYIKCRDELYVSYQKNQLEYVNLPSDMSSLLCDYVFNKKKAKKYIYYVYVCIYIYICILLYFLCYELDRLSRSNRHYLI